MKRLLLLLLSTLILCGCGDSNSNFVALGDGAAGPNNGLGLTVQANQAAIPRGIRAQFSGDITQFRVTLFDNNLNQLDQQTGTVTQAYAFSGLAEGDYLVRMVGLDATGNILGFFDRLVSLRGGNLTTIIPGLRPTNTPPSPVLPDAQGAPFALITQAPSAVTGGASFSVAGQVFDALGNPVSSAINNLTLSSNGVPFQTAPGTQNSSNNGSFSFTGLSFDTAANGTTFFQVNAAGIQSGLSNLVTVTPNTPGASRLNFVAVPSDGLVGQVLNPNVQVEALDTAGNRVTQAVQVTLTLGNGSSGNLGGTTTRATVNGLATFDNLTLDQVGGVSLVATAPSFQNGNSPTFQIMAPQGPRLNFVTVPTSGIQNQPVNPTIMVEALDANGDRVTTPVNIGLSGNGNLGGTLGATTVDGLASFPFATTPIVGPVTVVASANGFASTPPINFTVEPPAPFFTTLELVSRLTNGEASSSPVGNGGVANNQSRTATSADGRYVAFASQASNLSGGTFFPQVYRYDRTTDTLLLCSPSITGGASGFSQTGGTGDLHVSISNDGRYVCYASTADDLVMGDETNGPRGDGQGSDVFVFDANSGTVSRPIADDPQGQFFSPEISADGNFIVCETNSRRLGNVPNSVPEFRIPFNTIIFRRNAVNNEVTLLRTPAPEVESIRFPSVSGDGTRVAVVTQGQLDTDDTDDFDDVYVFNLGASGATSPPTLTGLPVLASRDRNGDPVSSPVGPETALSDDGELVTFSVGASEIVPGLDNPENTGGLYIRDLSTGVNRLVDFRAFQGEFSGDNRFVTYTASRFLGSTLRPFVFVVDLNVAGGERLQASVFGDDGDPAEANRASISADGTIVTFESIQDLLQGTTGGTYSVRNPHLNP